MKAKILVIVDVPGWALDRTAQNVIKRLGGSYEFTVVYNNGSSREHLRGNYDLHYLCYFCQLEDAKIKLQLPNPKITGIRSHFKWDKGRGLAPSEELLSRFNEFAAINVPSRILLNIFSPHLKNIFYTPHGVDCDLFKPADKVRNNVGKKKLLVGWAGSSSNHPGKRGLKDYLLPALVGLDDVELEMACRETKWRTQEEMVEYYQRMDLYICTSRTEGGPHPLLEASACGVPIVSTKVGHAPDLIVDGRNGFLVEREVKTIRQKVIQLRDFPELREQMGRSARHEVEANWHWDEQAPKYVPFFEAALKGLS